MDGHKYQENSDQQKFPSINKKNIATNNTVSNSVPSYKYKNGTDIKLNESSRRSSSNTSSKNKKQHDNRSFSNPIKLKHQEETKNIDISINISNENPHNNFADQTNKKGNAEFFGTKRKSNYGGDFIANKNDKLPSISREHSINKKIDKQASINEQNTKTSEYEKIKQSEITQNSQFPTMNRTNMVNNIPSDISAFMKSGLHQNDDMSHVNNNLESTVRQQNYIGKKSFSMEPNLGQSNLPHIDQNGKPSQEGSRRLIASKTDEPVISRRKSFLTPKNLDTVNTNLDKLGNDSPMNGTGDSPFKKKQMENRLRKQLVEQEMALRIKQVHLENEQAQLLEAAESSPIDEIKSLFQKLPDLKDGRDKKTAKSNAMMFLDIMMRGMGSHMKHIGRAEREKEQTAARKVLIRLKYKSVGITDCITKKYKQTLDANYEAIDNFESEVFTKEFKVTDENLQKTFKNFMKIVKKYNKEVNFNDIEELINTPHEDLCNICNNTLNNLGSDLQKNSQDFTQIEENKEYLFDVEKNKITNLRINSEKKKAPLKLNIFPMMGAKRTNYKFFVSINDENTKPDSKKCDALHENKTEFKIFPSNEKVTTFTNTKIYISFVPSETMSFKITAEYFKLDSTGMKNFQHKKKIDIFEQFKMDHDYSPSRKIKSMTNRKKVVKGKKNKQALLYKLSDMVLKRKRQDEKMLEEEKNMRLEKMFQERKNIILKNILNLRNNTNDKNQNSRPKSRTKIGKEYSTSNANLSKVNSKKFIQHDEKIQSHRDYNTSIGNTVHHSRNLDNSRDKKNSGFSKDATIKNQHHKKTPIKEQKTPIKEQKTPIKEHTSLSSLKSPSRALNNNKNVIQDSVKKKIDSTMDDTGIASHNHDSNSRTSSNQVKETYKNVLNQIDAVNSSTDSINEFSNNSMLFDSLPQNYLSKDQVQPMSPDQNSAYQSKRTVGFKDSSSLIIKESVEASEFDADEREVSYLLGGNNLRRVSVESEEIVPRDQQPYDFKIMKKKLFNLDSYILQINSNRKDLNIFNKEKFDFNVEKTNMIRALRKLLMDAIAEKSYYDLKCKRWIIFLKTILVNRSIDDEYDYLIQFHEKIRRMYAISKICIKSLTSYIENRAPDYKKRRIIDGYNAVRQYTNFVSKKTEKGCKIVASAFFVGILPILRIEKHTVVAFQFLQKIRLQVELFYNLVKQYKQLLSDNWAEFFMEIYEQCKKNMSAQGQIVSEQNNKKIERYKKFWVERHQNARKLQFSKDLYIFRQFKMKDQWNVKKKDNEVPKNWPAELEKNANNLNKDNKFFKLSKAWLENFDKNHLSQLLEDLTIYQLVAPNFTNSEGPRLFGNIDLNRMKKSIASIIETAIVSDN